MSDEKAGASGAQAGFDGSVRGLELPDLFQLYAHSRFTGCMVVKSGAATGRLYFRDGEVVHGEAGGMVGESACYELLSWQSGQFDLLRGLRADEVTVRRSAQYLLLEAHRRLDERRKAAEAMAAAGGTL